MNVLLINFSHQQMLADEFNCYFPEYTQTNLTKIGK